MDKTIFKSTILGALIITMSLIIIGVSGSYAYFTTSVEKTAGRDPGFSLTSGSVKMNFETTNKLEGTNVTLINEGEYTTKGQSSKFSITLPSDANVVSSAKYNIYLTDIKITKNMQSKYLKWALHKNGASEVIKTGDFSNVTLSEQANSDNTYNVTSFDILTDASISKGTTDSYTLYLWLENDPNVNQSDKSGQEGAVNLLDGKLEFKVGFRATT